MVGKQAKKEANSNYVTGSRVRILVKEGADGLHVDQAGRFLEENRVLCR